MIVNKKKKKRRHYLFFPSENENEQSANPAVPEVTLSQIDAQVNFKLFSARKDFAIVEQIEQRTGELLQTFSKGSNLLYPLFEEQQDKKSFSFFFK